ncbi:MAG: membrane protein insertase YidC [Elusimicrobia bacterium]|nr:membrane protein insertase YidC [Elusimicrobiota bacterium]
MEKNLLLAVTLSVGVYALWFGLVEKRLAPPRPAPSMPAALSPRSPSSSQNSPAKPERAGLEAEAEILALGKTQARVHPLGASLVSYRYEEPLGTVELIEDPQPGFLAAWPELRFKRNRSAPGVVYQAARPDGVKIIKEFIPESEGRLPRLRLTLLNQTRKPQQTQAWSLSLGPGLGTIASESAENHKVWRALALKDPGAGLKGKIEVLKPGNYQGPYRWVGIDNRYFLAAVIPDFKDFELVESRWPPQIILTAKSMALEPGQSRSWELPFYVGAKGHTWLSRYGAGLERSIDFGFFAQLGRMVLQILNFLHSKIGNWGWSIILLTALLQLALFPLTYKSLKAMSAMKRLQPDISRIQQKYGKDPQRLNAEMLELYKKHGANPLGGCLPMLLQMPVFIALYNALRNAWELHGAPWIFWIKDLSAKDPYYILPLVMGGLMFAQNKLNPPSTDPSQAAMMTWMPVIFTFMFLRFPSGLVLYWMTNSLLSATQQLLLKKRFNS